MHRYKQMVLTLITYIFISSLTFAESLPDFTSLVESYEPAVVNISTTRTVKAPRFQGSPSPFFNQQSDPFQDLLRRFFGDEGDTEEYSTKSLGSGFFISADGYILTNNHVIRDADEVIVRLSDGHEFQAQIVGSDEGSDLALLKVDEQDLPFINLGDSDQVKVGEWVLAIGSPFGFEHSVTAGIVSATKRGLRTEQYVPFIQTDAAINPGNSGGPLLNLKGEVIGINAQIVSRTGGYLGLSFAIPSNVAKRVVADLQGKGFVSRGWLGVAFQPLDRELAQSFGLKNPSGALVSEVVKDSPAEKGGFKRGDIITKFNDTTIDDAFTLSPLVGAIEPGTMVNVEVLRDKKTKTLKVKVGELPRDKRDNEEASKDKINTASELLGLEIREFTQEERAQFDLGSEGVLVEKVDRKGSASKAGIRRGDMIISLNQKEVKDEKTFKAALKDISPGQNIAILVNRRNEGQRYFAVKAEKSN